ncbi:hypothetical protein AB1278_00215 [Chryseobacterium sp. NRRL B-14798]
MVWQPIWKSSLPRTINFRNDLETINVTLEKLNAEVDLYRALGGGVQ